MSKSARISPGNITRHAYGISRVFYTARFVRMATADDLKSQGNAALADGRVDEALSLYGEAIALQPDSHVLYSNRSAAYCKSKRYAEALTDAEKVNELKPDWAKGYSRKGAALGFLERYEDAVSAYKEGLKLEPDNEQLKVGLEDVKDRLVGSDDRSVMNPFSDPLLWSKLENDPKTKQFLEDPQYKIMMQHLSSNSKDLGKYMQDPRIMTTLGVLLGVQLDMADAGSQPPPPKRAHSTAEKPVKKDAKPELSEAMGEKELGNDAYKKKDFEEALTHYNRAIELDPKAIMFRNNRAAVYFEKEEYDTCITECKEAVEIGRENKAEYKLISKALARIGNAYSKKGELNEALVFYNKSLSEHRDADIVKKAHALQTLIKEQDKLAYIDPDKAALEKDKGNQCFKKGDYPGAIKYYSEAVKRNPEDPKIFSNRAACFTKLAEFSMALRDCDECIRLDPTFVKGYLRKGTNLLAMKETTKAADAYQKAMALDANCQEALDGYRKSVMQDTDPDTVRQQAMQDPEVQAILADPAMQIILQQMQKEPKALQEHMKNPAVATKIQKLLESGLIAIR